jgi:hypothetical protein
MRPTFEVPVKGDEATVLSWLKAELKKSGGPCLGIVVGPTAELRICQEDSHFWSPALSIKVVSREEDGERVLRGRFGPHPHVWTMFMAIYGILAMIGLGGLMYGISQWALGWTPWALALAPASIALMAFTYGAVFIGQGLGAEQMYILRSVVDHALEAGAAAGESAGENTAPEGDAAATATDS